MKKTDNLELDTNEEKSASPKKVSILEEEVPSTYNKKDVFKKNIAPIIKVLKKECNLYKMPMFVTVAVSNNEKKTEYEHDIIMASTEVKLTDNRLSAIMLKLNGFDEKLPDYIQNDLREINEYIARLETKDNDALGIELTNDFIGQELSIVAGGDKVVAPESLTTKAISKEEASAIDNKPEEKSTTKRATKKVATKKATPRVKKTAVKKKTATKKTKKKTS